MTRPKLLILLLIVVTSAYYWQQQVQVPGKQMALVTSHELPAATNRLAIGEDAKVDTLDIAINAPAEFDYLTRDAVLQLRNHAIEQYPALLSGGYAPMPAIFGQIVDHSPWWGIEGQFYHGDGNRSIDGLSEESRFILNPYLLVAAEFNDWWMNDIEESEIANFPLVCLPQQLNWKPRDAHAEVSYDADCIRKRQRPEFSLIAYNARDLGLNYIYVSYADSQNVSKTIAPTTAYANPQFIHKGGSCGYPGGATT
jgi:hypothetical protein